MSKRLNKLLLLVMLLCLPGIIQHAIAAATNKNQHEETELDVKNLILHHVADAYEWHITKINDREIAIPLPVILYSKNIGFQVFMSSRFHKNGSYKGFTIAHEGKYEGKVVEIDDKGNQRRPFDISLTKNAFSLFISSFLLIMLIMPLVRSYKRNGFVPGNAYTVFMELFITDLYDNVIKSSLGKHAKKYAPYLLTLFFFIFVNNITGIIPIFPGGANVTGNITVTFALAFITFLIVNIKGSKEYWREILWPDVPWWLKVPLPVMPIIELVGIFMKPFALMIRLFANILAGHAVILALTSVIFVTVKLGIGVNAGMTVISILFSVFLGIVEVLVAYIQAYVFTLLTAIFISLARVEPHKKEEKSVTIHH
jgi:F-type H+-transporting ATPase subunit a